MKTYDVVTTFSGPPGVASTDLVSVFNGAETRAKRKAD
jgi:hypothetical protein